MVTLNDGLRYIAMRTRDRYPRALSTTWYPTQLWMHFAENRDELSIASARMWPFFVGDTVPLSDPKLSVLVFDPYICLTNRVHGPAGLPVEDPRATIQGYFDAFALYGVAAAVTASWVVMQRRPNPPATADLVRIALGRGPTFIRGFMGETLAGIANSQRFWHPVLEETEAFLNRHWAWALSEFDADDLRTGAFMNNIVAHERSRQPNGATLEGVMTARDTLLVHFDFLKAGPDGWLNPER